ncbi:MAG: hypothetical protein ACPGEF_00895 [Endozoicomonas sp.]
MSSVISTLVLHLPARVNLNRMARLALLCLFISSELMAYDNYCIDRWRPYPRHSQACPGKIIPAEKTRNFSAESLWCTQQASNHLRHPEELDEEAWLDLKNISRHEAAIQLREQASPQWSGILNYSTLLVWDWESCDLVTNGSICGYDTDCYENSDDTTTCIPIPRTCYTDTIHHEKTYCSPSQMEYDITFLKKDFANWNPEIAGYIDRLANGYDLLPGEEEVVTLNNKSVVGHSWLTPILSIDDPKNDYTINQQIHNQSPDSLSCRVNGFDKISFMIATEHRIASWSPNSFALPKAYDNESIPPLIWQSTNGRNGKREADGFPEYMRVQDFSAAALNEISEDVSQKLKNVVIRVQLYKPSIFGEQLKSTIYIDEAKGIQQTLNAISSNQKVRRSTLWEFKLNNGNLPEKNLYRSYVPSIVYYPGKIFLSDEGLSYDDHLAPDTEYTLKLTVYQKNMPFYNQSCEVNPDAWYCSSWYAFWNFINSNWREDQYFSKKSLDLKFYSNRNVDERTWLSTFWNFTRYAQLAIPVGAIALTAMAFL